MAKERLQKVVAQAGVASRRAAEELIEAGRVRVNGVTVVELGTKVDTRSDRVEVDGRRLVAEAPIYLILHKPRGVVSTVNDPEGRPTVRELLKAVSERVFPVGRLDFHTSGALLLTNDGEFCDALIHPKRNVPKTYVVKVQGEMREADRQLWADGVEVDGQKTRPAEIFGLRYEQGKSWLEVTLFEGRNQQIRKMGEATGFPVMRLARTSFAGVSTEGLRPGEYRSLARSELVDLREKYSVPRRLPKAGAGSGITNVGTGAAPRVRKTSPRAGASVESSRGLQGEEDWRPGPRRERDASRSDRPAPRGHAGGGRGRGDGGRARGESSSGYSRGASGEGGRAREESSSGARSRREPGAFGRQRADRAGASSDRGATNFASESPSRGRRSAETRGASTAEVRGGRSNRDRSVGGRDKLEKSKGSRPGKFERSEARQHRAKGGNAPRVRETAYGASHKDRPSARERRFSAAATDGGERETRSFDRVSSSRAKFDRPAAQGRAPFERGGGKFERAGGARFEKGGNAGRAPFERGSGKFERAGGARFEKTGRGGGNFERPAAKGSESRYGASRSNTGGQKAAPRTHRDGKPERPLTPRPRPFTRKNGG